MPTQYRDTVSSQRVVRVFVSSTFRDMQAEREELVKRVFPQLRKLCEDRGVTWGEVDLRWGVTDEHKAEGKVLPICLGEIHNCRPYFIGLLGERYGWVPEEIGPAMIEREPWLLHHRGRSVTELEILHGVLNNPAMARHAFFYLRDPSYIDSIQSELQPVFREVPTAEEIELHGAEEARRRTDERKDKLNALKMRIRGSGFPVRDNYPRPSALGKQVLADLTGLIDRLFPAGSQPDPLDREVAQHDAFAASRAGVYVGREEYFGALNAHARGDGPPLVVLGDSGSGKSALLANWAVRYRAAQPTTILLLHFIGATRESADWAAIVRRILGEFKRHLGMELEIPDSPDGLRAAFANALHMVAARARVVLILDGLNHLEDRDQAPELVWLPPEIPANLRLILSSLPGRPLDELEKRGWPALRVKPLDLHERKQLITAYLAQYTKALSVARTDRIAGAPQTANPLYLRSLLEELRVWGDHLTLDRRIDHYLSAVTVPELFERILQRYEEDYERERPGLVRDAMSLLFAARRGLSEAELTELLGANGEPLPQAQWAPLHLAAEQSLVGRSGLIGFHHDYIRHAVRDRYLPTGDQQQAAHLRLADYFDARELGPRKAEELPWQLAKVQSWQRLSRLLGDLHFFDAASKASEFDVRRYWAEVEHSSDLRLVNAYRPVLEAPARHSTHVWQVAALLYDTGHLEESFELRQYLVARYRETGDAANLQGVLGNQANILYARGDLDGAMALYREQERLCREQGNAGGLQISLNNQAGILRLRGDLDRAMALLQEQERLCRELGNKDGLQASLGNQAGILRTRGELDAAMPLYRSQERLCRELGNRNGLQISLDGQATILCARGDLDGAMALHEEQERICRELGNRHGLQASLGRQAAILADRGDLDGAMALFKEQERLCRELGYKDGLQISLGDQALILEARGDLEGALVLQKEQERLCRELGNKDGLQISLNNQAFILKARGELDGAMALHKEQERICRELGNKGGLQASLGNQALILEARGDLEGALALHQEQERICRELGHVEGLAISLANQAALSGRGTGRRPESLALAEEAYWLATRHRLTALAKQIEPILQRARAQMP